MPQPQTPRAPLAEVVASALRECGFENMSEVSRRAGIPLTTLHRHLHNGDFRVSELDELARLIGTQASVLKARAERLEMAA